MNSFSFLFFCSFSFFFYHIPSKEIWLKWKGFQWPCQWIGALSIHLAYSVTQTLPLNSNFSSQPLCCYYPPMLCPQKLPKKTISALCRLDPFLWPLPRVCTCHFLLALLCANCLMMRLSITDHWTYCSHSSLVCTDFLLQRGELSTCQILTVSFLPGCSVPLGSDSHAFILPVYRLSETQLGLGS